MIRVRLGITIRIGVKVRFQASLTQYKNDSETKATEESAPSAPADAKSRMGQADI